MAAVPQSIHVLLPRKLRRKLVKRAVAEAVDVNTIILRAVEADLARGRPTRAASLGPKTVANGSSKR